MYKVNLVAMVVLCLAVLGGAAYFVSRSGPELPAPPSLADWIRDLGDPDPEVGRRAEERLRGEGRKAHDALRVAANSMNQRRARRARRLLSEMGLVGVRSEKRAETVLLSPRPDKGVKSPPRRGVAVEISMRGTDLRAGLLPRFYVRIQNHETAPVLVARQLWKGRRYYQRYARFEIVDPEGKTVILEPEMEGVEPHAGQELVRVAPGSALDLYAGQEDGRTGFDAALPPGTYRVRFVYDASAKSDYRRGLIPNAKGVPLPPRALASAYLTFRVVD